MPQAVLKIDISALKQNWLKCQEVAGNSVAAAVVKANAYGIGIEKSAKIFFGIGCHTFFVANLEEGIGLRKILGKSPKIFVFGGVFENEIATYIEYDLIPSLNDFWQIEIWKIHAKSYPCAINIDTGINRLGIAFEEAYQLKLNGLNIELFYSHLANSSNPQSDFNQKQLARFLQVADNFSKMPLSIAASGGSFMGQEYILDLIRPGIGLYGGNPYDKAPNPFTPIIELQAPILQIRDVKKGASIGYSQTFIAKENKKIAILNIGYADGFLRSASNQSFVWYKEKFCPVVGRVSMDMIAIDISEIMAQTKIGEYVEIIGQNLSLEKQAGFMNSVGYEVLTLLSDRFCRTYVE